MELGLALPLSAPVLLGLPCSTSSVWSAPSEMPVATRWLSKAFLSLVALTPMPVPLACSASRPFACEALKAEEA